jgi:hypothetical protein
MCVPMILLVGGGGGNPSPFLSAAQRRFTVFLYFKRDIRPAVSEGRGNVAHRIEIVCLCNI